MRSGFFFLGFFYLTYQKVEIIWLLTTHKPLFSAGISRPAMHMVQREPQKNE
jgi:hypothetical protein